MMRRLAPPWRLHLLSLVIGLGFAAVIGRLVQLQVLEHQQHAARARLFSLTSQDSLTLRGAIVDAGGHPLAISITSFDVLVEKRAWEDPEKALAHASRLAQMVGGDPRRMVEEVRLSPAFEQEVVRGLTLEQAREVEGLRLPGVRLRPNSRRVHPEGSLAAQLLGIVGRDGLGLSGLEADLDEALRQGAKVVLTIDRVVQRAAEEALDQAIKQHNARGGSVVVVDAKSGALLAMASRPSFDLDRPPLDDPKALDLFRNPVVTDTYEPGSVLKVVTVAAAIDQGLVSPKTVWQDTGVALVAGWPIYNWDYSARGTQTVTDILVKSLNTGAVWLARLLGPERFYEYLGRFGFGRPTDVGLGGEASGHVRWPQDPLWSPVDLATNSFGQGIAATPLQVAMAVAAIANDGLLMRPYVVKAIVTPQETKETRPQVVGQVVSPETARVVREMMGAVAESIRPPWLEVPGYRVGGKTGTANVVEGGLYKPDAYIASFAGIVPLDDPRLVILVKIDEPKSVPWGTVVAAPVFAKVAKTALAHYRVPPEPQALSRAP
jgi:cell division protein FtsI/penicillin-binding protein 2